jgi:hypothetical protein
MRRCKMAESLGAYGNLAENLLGMPYGIDPFDAESPVCSELLGIDYGDPVVEYPGYEGLAYKPHTDTVTLTQSADFSASNSTVLTLNGVALDAVVYATSNANTQLLLKAAILVAIPTAIVTISTSRIIIVTTHGADITLTGVVTGGSAVTLTPAYSTVAVFAGIAMFMQISHKTYTGGYKLYDAMTIMRRGKIWAYASKAVNSDTKAYVIYAAGATQGQLTDSASSTLLTSGVFRKTITVAGNVLLEVLSHKNI